MKNKYNLPLITIALLFYACKPNNITLSISTDSDFNNCLKLKEIVSEYSIENIITLRPLGKSIDTAIYSLDRITHLYGERLFTLGDEKFECRNIDSLVNISNSNLLITVKKSGYITSGPFTQEYVSNYWEFGNGFLLGKQLPKFNGQSYKSSNMKLEEIIHESNKTLIHFGWLNCKGCLIEQELITELKDKHPDITFVSISINNIETLDKYLVDRGDYFETTPPYNKLSERINKPLFIEEKNKLLELFKLKGLFPVNFLIDKSGSVEKIGPILKIFDHESNIEVIEL